MTQLNSIKALLEMGGFVSRNYCLRNHVTSRLAARIRDLEKAGWTFRTSKRDGDFIYWLVEKPEPTKYKMHDMVEQPQLFQSGGY